VCQHDKNFHILLLIQWHKDHTWVFRSSIYAWLVSWLQCSIEWPIVTVTKSSKVEANQMLSFHLFWFRLGKGWPHWMALYIVLLQREAPRNYSGELQRQRASQLLQLVLSRPSTDCRAGPTSWRQCSRLPPMASWVAAPAPLLQLVRWRRSTLELGRGEMASLSYHHSKCIFSWLPYSAELCSSV
jgi:hypothetical protein